MYSFMCSFHRLIRVNPYIRVVQLNTEPTPTASITALLTAC